MQRVGSVVAKAACIGAGTEQAINALVAGFDKMNDRGAAGALMSGFLGKDWPAIIGATRTVSIPALVACAIWTRIESRSPDKFGA